MSGNNRTAMNCGPGTCFPIFTGRRITSDRLPEDFSVCHILRCSDGKLYRRKRTDRGPTWEVVNVPAGTPYVFYDITCELICLMNFNGNIGGSSCALPVRPINPNPVPGQPVSPVLPTPINNGGQGGIRPANQTGVITPVQSAFLASTGRQSAVNNFLTRTVTGSATTPIISGSTIPFSGQTQTGLNGQSTAVLTSAGAIDTTGSIPLTAVGDGAGGGDDIIFGSVQDSSTIAVLQSTGDGSGPTAGATASGSAVNQSAILAAGDGSMSKGSAQDRSTISATDNGASAMGDATAGSLVGAAAAGSKAHGRASEFSGVRAGIAPGEAIPMRDLPANTSYLFTSAGTDTVNFDRRTLSSNTIDVTRATNNGCEVKSVRLQNINTADADILNYFSSEQAFGPFTGTYAPGLGDGSTAAGCASRDAFVMASGDGAIAHGTAECGRLHMAAGKGSAVFGSENIALAPQSQAVGRRAFAYMAGSTAHSSFEAPSNAVLPSDCVGACQRITVMTKGSTVCIRDPPTGAQNGFILTTSFVLADSPDNPLIITPDGGQIDLSKVPFLHCPGTAYVEADLVSPALIGDRNQNLGPAICAKYAFCVSRTDLNGQSSHDITGFQRLYASPPEIDNFITVEATSSDSINEGFTLQVRDLIPLDINGSPNPRLRFNGAGDPVNPIMGRIFCVYFTITFTSTGYVELNCLINDALLSGIDGPNDNGRGQCRKCNSGKNKRRGCYCEEKGFTPELPMDYSLMNSGNRNTSLI